MALKLKNTVRNKTPADLLNDEVDLTISKQVVINADIRFKRLVRIDGRFEGKLIPAADASIIVTRRGHYLGDIIGLNLAYIDGKVEGNIYVQALELGPHANVCGNIMCRRIVIAGHAKYTGELNVSPSNSIPPPPQPPQSAPLPPSEPETLDETGADEVKEVHLVEDDDAACNIEEKRGEATPPPDEKLATPVAPPRKTNALIIYEPQVDLLANSGLWPEIESDESAQEQVLAMHKLCSWIESNGSKLDYITVLLDIHYKPGLNDGHFWKLGNLSGNIGSIESVEHPEVGTVITLHDIVEKVWVPAVESNEVFVQQYLMDNHGGDANDSVESTPIVIKPKHCQIGSTGAAVVDSLNKVLNAWSKQNQRDVEYLVTQHNLANNAPGHWLYDRNQLEHVGSQVDRVYLAGQVLGHCHSFHIVADLAAGLVETLGVSDDKEITLLTDALIVSGATKTGRDEMMDEVIAASQLQQVLLATTEDAAIA